MFSTKADAPFQVNVPAYSEDHPSWTRAGVIAVIGFLIGVGWPKLAGVRLGPSLPETASATAAGPSASASEPSAPGATPPAASSVPAMAATPLASAGSAAAAPPPSVTVSKGTVTSCRSADGDTLKGGDCGAIPGLDNLVMPRLRKLGECGDAAQVSGKVRFVVRVDFPHNTLAVELGKNPGVTVPDGLVACAKEDFNGATPPGASHDNPRYSLAYAVTFGNANPSPSMTPSAAAPVHVVSSESTQVVWEVALVRDAPKTGKVVARLQRGTALQIGQGKDGWFPVKFGDGFTGEGWVYRGAIGR
jgi:hypothetical protein